MPFLPGSLKVSCAYHPEHQPLAFPAMTGRGLLEAARNAALAMAALHDAGYCLGDISQNNMLIDARSVIGLIDVDSFQVPGPDGQVFLATPGAPNFLPPEVLALGEGALVPRTEAQDRFSLGILLFLMLTGGHHPFHAPSEPREFALATPVLRLRRGPCPYAPPNPVAPAFGLLHPELRNLFLQCFVEGFQDPQRRPSARQWAETLAAVTNACLPLVSIIIANYNYGRFLGEAIQSALDQTYPAVEIILVDDGSEDDSLAVASRYPIQIHAHPHAGVSASRNAGASLSRGEYLLFLDAEDQLYPSQVFTPAALIAGTFVNICCLIRRRAFEAAGGWDPSWRLGLEDYEFWVRLLHHGHHGLLVPEPLHRYRRHGLSRNDLDGPQRKHLKWRLRLTYPRLFWRKILQHPVESLMQGVKLGHATHRHGPKARGAATDVVEQVRSSAPPGRPSPRRTDPATGPPPDSGSWPTAGPGPSSSRFPR